MDSIAQHLEPTGLWTGVVEVVLGIVVGLFQLVTLVVLIVAVDASMSHRNRIVMDDSIVPSAELKATTDEDRVYFDVLNGTNIDSGNVRSARDRTDKLTYVELVRLLPKFDDGFWSQRSVLERLGAELKKAANTNKGLFVPRVLTQFFDTVRRESNSLQNPVRIQVFLESCAHDRRDSFSRSRGRAQV